jgi:hypothetical protein
MKRAEVGSFFAALLGRGGGGGGGSGSGGLSAGGSSADLAGDVHAESGRGEADEVEGDGGGGTRVMVIRLGAAEGGAGGNLALRVWCSTR